VTLPKLIFYRKICKSKLSSKINFPSTIKFPQTHAKMRKTSSMSQIASKSYKEISCNISKPKELLLDTQKSGKNNTIESSIKKFH
jgi:hypothetical protein